MGSDMFLKYCDNLTVEGEYRSLKAMCINNQKRMK